MCEPGVINNHLAVKINEIIQNGGEVEDEWYVIARRNWCIVKGCR
jgi:hypothetical protein